MMEACGKTMLEHMIFRIKQSKKLDEIIVKLGQISIQKIQIESTENELKNEFFKTQQEESTLAKTLSDKYGVGTLDIESGKFTPQS